MPTAENAADHSGNERRTHRGHGLQQSCRSDSPGQHRELGSTQWIPAYTCRGPGSSFFRPIPQPRLEGTP